MSISRHFDLYMAERGITPSAEVEPEHPCQVFIETEADNQQKKLAEAEEKLRKLLAD